MQYIANNKPIFVIGNPRSGTSLLRLMLTCHPCIVIPPECGFIVWLYSKYKDWNIDSSNNNFYIKSFIDDLFNSKKFETWKLDKTIISKEIKLSTPKNYSELCFLIYCCYGISISKKFKIWGDKNNHYLHHLNDISNIFPYARYLHIVRDGRDVACSYRNVMSIKSASLYAPNLPTKINKISTEWKDSVTKIEHFFSQLQAKYSYTVKFEDLTANPVDILSQICRWLKISFESKMLNFYIENQLNHLEPLETLDWKKRTLEPIKSDSVGQYRKMMNCRDQLEFMTIAEGTLKKFGYL